jgi:hypothetical protein
MVWAGTLPVLAGTGDVVGWDGIIGILLKKTVYLPPDLVGVAQLQVSGISSCRYKVNVL